MFPNIYRRKKIRKNEKFEKSEKFRGNKLSRMKTFEKFRGINFRRKGQKTRNRQSFWQRKFLTLKYYNLFLHFQSNGLNSIKSLKVSVDKLLASEYSVNKS